MTTPAISKPHRQAISAFLQVFEREAAAFENGLTNDHFVYVYTVLHIGLVQRLPLSAQTLNTELGAAYSASSDDEVLTFVQRVSEFLPYIAGQTGQLTHIRDFAEDSQNVQFTWQGNQFIIAATAQIEALQKIQAAYVTLVETGAVAVLLPEGTQILPVPVKEAVVAPQHIFATGFEDAATRFVHSLLINGSITPADLPVLQRGPLSGRADIQSLIQEFTPEVWQAQATSLARQWIREGTVVAFAHLDYLDNPETLRAWGVPQNYVNVLRDADIGQIRYEASLYDRALQGDTTLTSTERLLVEGITPVTREATVQ